jgi:cysteine-rich repeat protein
MAVIERVARCMGGLFVPVVAAGLVSLGAGVARATDGPTCAALGALACGDADRDGSVTSTDALLALQAGIGVLYCDGCLCDASGGSNVTATDALMLLQQAVGGQVPLACETCDESACGDSVRTPFRGAPLGTTIDVADWCLLLDADPNNLEQDITVTITKALDTWLMPVAGVTTSIRNRGCDCGFLRTHERADGQATTTPALGSVTTSTLGFCNCMVGVRAESPVPLALVEAFIDLYDGDCGDFVGSGTALVDGGVEEECDDGNLVSGDGCSAECRTEPDATVGPGGK